MASRFHFVDVREDGEFAVDHAAGARHIGRGMLERDIETLIPDKDAPTSSSTAAAATARRWRPTTCSRMGYTNVVSMDGGIRAWREAGYAIEPGGGTR